MENIPLIKPYVSKEAVGAIDKVLKSGMLTDGKVTREFEQDIQNYVNVGHALAAPSCHFALELAIRVLKLTKKDEVLVPDYTHPSTINAVLSGGATPALVDVDPETYNISYESIEENITEHTKAIMPVSLFGQPLDAKKIMHLAKKHDLFVIEDAACSLGASFDGVQTGALPTMTCFSFHPRKVIATGEGGMLVTNNQEYHALAKKMRMFGGNIIEGTKIFEYHELGGNYKFSNILAALGRAQLKDLDTVIKQRVQKAHYYIELLKDTTIAPPKEFPNTVHTFQSFCCLVPPSTDRNKLILNLKEKGIEAQIGSYCLSIQPIFKNIRKGTLQNSVDIYNRSLTLPLFHTLTTEQQDYVIKELTKLV